jgi:hypothetical protein
LAGARLMRGAIRIGLYFQFTVLAQRCDRQIDGAPLYFRHYAVNRQIGKLEMT